MARRATPKAHDGSGSSGHVPKLRPRDLELLVAVHEHRSITAAAQQPRLTQPAATVEASSTKVIHLVISANIRMLGIVPSVVGQDIQRLGGVRSLPFPVSLSIPPVGLLWATRHRDTPVVRSLRSNIRDILRKRRVVQ